MVLNSGNPELATLARNRQHCGFQTPAARRIGPDLASMFLEDCRRGEPPGCFIQRCPRNCRATQPSAASPEKGHSFHFAAATNAISEKALCAALSLYLLNRGDLAMPILYKVPPGLGELTARHEDVRCMLQLGNAALNRGLPCDVYAYPVIGTPTTAATPCTSRPPRTMAPCGFHGQKKHPSQNEHPPAGFFRGSHKRGVHL